jgi:hypothetical protein
VPVCIPLLGDYLGEARAQLGHSADSKSQFNASDSHALESNADLPLPFAAICRRTHRTSIARPSTMPFTSYAGDVRQEEIAHRTA